ncbi:MAG TPA: hypothetical protein VFZ36_01670 [Vicinamibacterales bacterium]
MTQPLTRRLALVLMMLYVCAPQADAEAQWNDYVNREGRLLVALPCAPVWKAEDVPRKGADASYRSHIGMCKAGDETYLVGWVDYEAGYAPEVQGELAANRDNTIKGIEGAQLLTSTSVSYQGLPGMDFTARIGARHLTSRVLLQGRRPYQLLIVTPLDADRSRNISRFLTSFQLIAE